MHNLARSTWTSQDSADSISGHLRTSSFNVADPVLVQVDVLGLAIVKVLDGEAPSASGAGDNTRVDEVAFISVAHCKNHKTTKTQMRFERL